MMRKIVLLALSCLACLSSIQNTKAEDLQTVDGRSFKGIRVLKEEEDKIKISHSDGITMVPKKVLPAEFLTAHELTAPPADPEMDAKLETQAKLKQFIDQFPSFSTKDGRDFKSSEIMALEPSGLKLMTDVGIVRVRFLDLVERYKTALGYDPEAAAKFDEQQEIARQESDKLRQKMAGAASAVDANSGRVRLTLIENIGKAWICRAEILQTIQEDEVTARSGSSLSGPRVVYETRQVSKLAVVGELDSIVVFGLPLYGSSPILASRKWEGMIYGFSYCPITSVGSSDSTPYQAFHTDRTSAVNFFAKYNGSYISINGDPLEEKENESGIAGTSSATGFAISKDGYIATSDHVVSDASEVWVYLDKKPYKAEVIARDKKNDLAIVKIAAETKPLYLYEGEYLLGVDLFTIGFPLSGKLGSSPKFTKGSLSGLDGGEAGGNGCIQFSVPIQNGNSGGAVCNDDGAVLGVVMAILLPDQNGVVPQNVNFAVKSALLRKLAENRPGIELAENTVHEVPQQAVLEATFFIKIVKK